MDCWWDVFFLTMWVFLIHFHLLISLLNISAGFEPWDEWTPENCKNSWTCQFSADFQHWSRSMMCIFPGELKLPWFLWFKDFNLCILVSTCFKWITLLPHVGFFSWRFCFFFSSGFVWHWHMIFSGRTPSVGRETAQHWGVPREGT